MSRMPGVNRETIAGYRITDTLFQSSRTVVKRAVRESDNQKVILKILNREHPSNSEIDQLVSESHLITRCNHPTIVKCTKFVTLSDTNFLVLEDIEGIDLSHFLKENGKMSLSLFLHTALEISKALQEIHQQRIIHKDINPSNILIHETRDTIQIIDFGIASILPREKIALRSPDYLEGTLAYLSPEQTGRVNRSIDYRTDFYSLGVTLYELITGKLPFNVDESTELVYSHIAKLPPAPIEVDGTTPQIISDIIIKLMAKQSEERYQSAAGLIHDLTICIEWFKTKGNLSHCSFSLGEQDISSTLEIPQKLYGRENEIQKLEKYLNIVATGSTEIITITGFSGIGKSSLVQEVHRTLFRKKGYFLSGKFDQFQHNIPYSAVVDAFRELVQQILMESEESLAILKKELVASLGTNGAVITSVLPEIELIIGKQPAVPTLGAVESQKRFNLTFQSFLSVLCTPVHPVVLFLDDLQWVDSATLNLLELLSSESNNSLLLILAYRDNEIDTTHPLEISLGKIREKNVIIEEIQLTPLTKDSVAQLIGETVHQNRDEVERLTTLIMNKTEGNPFFVNQFIQTLYEDNLLNFVLSTETKNGKWQWDIEKIEALNITDNVVELMIAKLKKLPQSAQKLMMLASSIGNNFDIETLSVICKKESSETFKELVPLLQEGLLLPLADVQSDVGFTHTSQFKFLHDRVQQASYSLVSESEREILHLTIARLLIEQNSENYLEENLFDITSHYNQGLNLITDEAEKVSLAKLNLRSGVKSRGFSSYSASFEFLEMALNLLPKNIWDTDYDLAFEISMAFCESGFLAMESKKAEKRLEQMFGLVKTAYERAEIYRMQGLQYMVWKDTKKALFLFIKALEQLHVKVPPKPSLLTIIKELHTANRWRGKKSVEDILSAPQISDKSILLTTKILSDLVMPAFITQQGELFAVVCLKLASISLRYGNSPEVAFGYIAYGMILNSMGKFKDAYDIAQLGLQLSTLLPNIESRGRVHFFYTYIIHIWNRPWQELEREFQNTIELAKEGGDFIIFAWGAVNVVLRQPDISLVVQLEKLYDYHKLCTKMDYDDAASAIIMLIQRNLSLLGKTDSPFTFSSENFNEDEFIKKCNRLDVTVASPFYLYICQVLFIHDNAKEALKLIPKIDIGRKIIDGTGESILHSLYVFLSFASCYAHLSSKEQKVAKNRMKIELKRVTKWASYNPENFEHLKDIMLAERARMSGDTKTAQTHFAQAIEGAKKISWLQHIALYNERFAEYWYEQGNEFIGNIYIKEAHYRYQVWGATVKVGLLEQRYPFLTQAIVPDNTTLSASKTTTQQFDISTVLKATHTLSEELNYEELINKMLYIAMENAGAEEGFFLIFKDDRWIIDAKISENYKTEFLNAIPLDTIVNNESVPICSKIINQVINSKKSVIVNDSSKDSYGKIGEEVAKSVAAIPLISKKKIIAIIYLNNNLITNAFTPQHLTVLELISSEMATATENSLLYRSLEIKNRELEISTKKALEASKVKGDFLANLSHEIRTPMNAIIGLTNFLIDEDISAATKESVNSIKNNSNDLLKIINHILDFSEIESGNLSLNSSVTTLNSLIDSIEKVSKSMIDLTDLSWSFDKKVAQEVWIDCDSSRIKQAVVCLVENAIKFTSQGEIALSVILHNDDLVFRVSDTGIGIEENKYNDIFNSFTQADTSTTRQYGGLGLGLTLVKRIADLMHGVVTVKSTIGSGSVFTLSIPLTTVEQSEVDIAPSQKRVEIERESLSILVVEDNKTNQNIIKRILTKLNYRNTHLADDGLEAITLLEENHFDVILMDCQMPVMDGYEATKEIRKGELKGVDSTVPIIAITANAMPGDREKCINAGMNDYLTKPINVSLLDDKIKMWAGVS